MLLIIILSWQVISNLQSEVNQIRNEFSKSVLAAEQKTKKAEIDCDRIVTAERSVATATIERVTMEQARNKGKYLEEAEVVMRQVCALQYSMRKSEKHQMSVVLKTK